MSIRSIRARQIFDSRGCPTVEVDVITDKGLFRAAVPSGALYRSHEAIELRDQDESYMGMGVLKAVQNVDTIAKALIEKGFNVTEQRKIDDFMRELDGTKNKGKLGVNAILGVSLAVCKAGAAEEKIPLYRYIANLAGVKRVVIPVPSFNVLNGGRHAGNKLAFHGFTIMPVGAKSFKEAMQMGFEVYHHLKRIIEKNYGPCAINVGDEGGFTPNISNGMVALDLIDKAIGKAGYTGKIKIAMDAASSEFYGAGKYDLHFKNNDNASSTLFGEQLAGLYTEMKTKHPIVSIEDPFYRDDWESWSSFTAKAGIQIVGDALTVTNPERVQKAISLKACNALLLKINQIGTMSEAIDASNMAFEAGWGVMVSHRYGETEDTSIADIAVGLCAGQIKAGAPCRSERLAKYNQLLRIEEELGADAVYAGCNFRTPHKI